MTMADAALPAPARVASVLLPLPLPEAFDYAEPESFELAEGDVVHVPLGTREACGVVVALRPGQGANRLLKPVLARADAARLPATTLAFIDWAARYCVGSPGQALAIALRGLRAPGLKPEKRLQATGVEPSRMTPARRRILEAAAEPIKRSDLKARADASPAVISGLVSAGALTIVETTTRQSRQPSDPHPDLGRLNPSQAAATASILESMENGFSVSLLDGVTGSGKTEVILECIAGALARDPAAQALILLPEIALTPAVLERVAARFGVEPTPWHSGMGAKRRRAAWDEVASGEAKIVVGARSALFLPFKALRLIVVDEEHDSSFKQEEGFIYQGRDLAVVRAKIEGCAAILSSATPSLETVWNAMGGRYRWLRLTDRHGGSVMPDIQLLDLRHHAPPPGRWISAPLAEAVGETLARGEQSLLFLNRRGYAPLVLCRACGERLRAPDTDSWLVEHRYLNRLVCHLTGFSMPRPERCPYCEAEHSLISIGPGVERLEEEARALFPEARIGVFSSDTVQEPGAARALVAAMSEGELDILVATQAAAKGHDFPNLTLVGVVDADLGLRGGDLRAAERTWQLLTQVSGRAGRRERAGRALVQTAAPDHPVMQAMAADDREAFIASELAAREAAGLPPFTRLAALIVSGEDLAALESFTLEMARAAPNAIGVDLFGPSDAPLALIRGRRRKRFLVRAGRSIDLQAYLHAWRARIKPKGSIRVAIDVDPYSFL